MKGKSGKSAVRRRIKHARNGLRPEERAIASQLTCANIARSPVFRAARRVGLYLPVRGELDVTPLQRLAWRCRKKVYLPVVLSSHRMEFARLRPTTPLFHNRYGIPEPAPGATQIIDPRELDLVLTPLVAFDRFGNRLGMGAGYYDRCFRFLKDRRAWRKPKLLGVAYSFQELVALEPAPWDIALWGIATEQTLRVSLRTSGTRDSE